MKGKMEELKKYVVRIEGDYEKKLDKKYSQIKQAAEEAKVYDLKI